MFKIIRCGEGYDPVIVVSPPEAGVTPNMPGVKYYRYASWGIGGRQSGVFSEIGCNEALGYFSGMADGIGFEAVPSDVFPSLEATFQYVMKKRNEWGRKRLKEMGINPDQDE